MSGKYNRVKQVLETTIIILLELQLISNRSVELLHRFRAKWDIVWDSLKMFGIWKMDNTE
jgi:hypothetical protein